MFMHLTLKNPYIKNRDHCEGRDMNLGLPLQAEFQLLGYIFTLFLAWSLAGPMILVFLVFCFLLQDIWLAVLV